MVSYDLRKLGHLDPHPIMAHPDFYPEHVLDMPLGADTPAIHNGVRPHGKVGDHRFIAHHKDLLGPDGRPLPIIPVFADRMRSGKIWYPGKDHNMKNPQVGKDYEEAHGGPGFGSLSQWYGKWGWANLHDSGNGPNTPGRVARALWQLAQESPHGFIGAVVTASHTGTTGNKQLVEYLRHHLHHHNTDPKKMAEFLTSVAGHGDIDSFIDHLHTMATSTRQDLVKRVLTAKGRNADGKEFLKSLKLDEILPRFNDYGHVPANHAVSLFKVSKDHPHAGMFPVDAPDGHPVYRWHVGGTYLGDLLHSIPIQKIVSTKIGEKPFQKPFSSDPASFYLYGAPNKNRVGTAVDNPKSDYHKWAQSGHPDAQYHMDQLMQGKGDTSLGNYLIPNAHSMRLDPEPFMSSSVVQKSVVIKMSPEHESLDKAQRMRYNHTQEAPTMRTIPPEVLEHSIAIAKHELRTMPAETPEAIEAKTMALIDEALHPHTQAKLHQAIRGEVKR